MGFAALLVTLGVLGPPLVAAASSCLSDGGHEIAEQDSVGLLQLSTSVLSMPPNPYVDDSRPSPHLSFVAAEVGSSLANEITAGQQLSARMQDMAKSLPAGTTRSLLQSFRICAPCQQFSRLGEVHDGGYLTCMDNLAGNITAAFSMGVEQHDQWSDDVARVLKVPVHQFDCTVSEPASTCADCHFYQACLKAPDGGGAIAGKTSWTMDEALRQSGTSSVADRSLLMKMDIEGAEWPILAAGGTFLSKFRQVILEFHFLQLKDNHPMYLKALQQLAAAGFYVAHIHGNNVGPMYEEGGYSVPQLIEVTLVSAGKTSKTCMAQQEYLPDDAANIESKAELPLAHLPS